MTSFSPRMLLINGKNFGKECVGRQEVFKVLAINVVTHQGNTGDQADADLTPGSPLTLHSHIPSRKMFRNC